MGEGAKMIYAPGARPRCHCSSEVGQGALEHWFAGVAQFEVTPLVQNNVNRIT